MNIASIITWKIRQKYMTQWCLNQDWGWRGELKEKEYNDKSYEEDKRAEWHERLVQNSSRFVLKGSDIKGETQRRDKLKGLKAWTRAKKEGGWGCRCYRSLSPSVWCMVALQCCETPGCLWAWEAGTSGVLSLLSDVQWCGSSCFCTGAPRSRWPTGRTGSLSEILDV